MWPRIRKVADPFENDNENSLSMKSGGSLEQIGNSSRTQWSYLNWLVGWLFSWLVGWLVSLVS
jgi:hypothetical protein